MESEDISDEQATSPVRRRTGGKVAVGAAIWLAIAGGSAAIVANTGGGAAAVAAARTSASASASPSAAAVLPTLPATPSPSPSSTVKGYVHGTSHSGDLRFFLLPVPDDAEAYGDPDGTTESVSDIANAMSNSSTSKQILHDYGCTGGATRTYRTNDGLYTVAVHLIHFGSAGSASEWVSGLSYAHGDSFDVSGVSNAKGQAIDPSESDGTGTLIGVSHVGDVEYEIVISGTGALNHSLLTPLMRRQEQRLGSGS
ncbi:hypothetical protein [Streptacidiphilus neutrinimicus]|uniref:hypothetical protein n=1 Tax=Streptacidiphilus neutrinimicus TaxID=105420 RepID=UPI00126A0047|nr:hypothetical protein [Streptacidiphilus neutrinimicus]